MTTDFDTRARELAHELHRRMDGGAPLGADHYGIIATALRQVEAETIERAAKELVQMAADRSRSDVNARQAAERIRALKEV